MDHNIRITIEHMRDSGGLFTKASHSVDRNANRVSHGVAMAGSRLPVRPGERTPTIKLPRRPRRPPSAHGTPLPNWPVGKKPPVHTLPLKPGQKFKPRPL